MQPVLNLAIPNKGRLSDDALTLLRRAGIRLEGSSERRLFAHALGGRLMIQFLRAADIPRFVANGTVDMGITGHDVVEESEAEVEERLDLRFGGCRLVLAVPESHPAKRAADLPDGTRVATSFPNLAKRHFAAAGTNVKIVPVSGACEVTPTLGAADAIVDLTSSGSTLRMNHLREVEDILNSTCRLIARPGLSGAAADEAERLTFALQSVLAARGKRYLLADVPRDTLPAIREFLPGLAGPTVVEVAGDEDLVAIQVVVDDDAIYDAVHRLRELGGRGILVVPIDRMVE